MFNEKTSFWVALAVVLGFVALLWVIPARSQEVGAPMSLRAYACSQPKYVIQVNNALVTATKNQSMRQFLVGFNSRGNKCLPLQGVAIYNGIHSVFKRSDGKLVAILEFTMSDARRFYSWRLYRGNDA